MSQDLSSAAVVIGALRVKSKEYSLTNNVYPVQTSPLACIIMICRTQ